ncbi:hypothetical protein NQK81_27230 [Amycolatopsis roodepoortensis]|uniref:hypothetical protein n=1 Tax=Amycolatopsis roodepoortensis TaxID=700274 RepID=UPI00214BFE4B|nr:hypothetical protein [Amycolatopsis roodepoortensis]UUV28480.1 hypothetical protein NQK81_27230 [Amycolatopsis roodepoortensis]
MKQVFPYKTLFGDIKLEVVSVAVDGDSLPYTRISTGDRVVALHDIGRDRWEVATLGLNASVPREKGPWEDIRCMAVLAESATNARRTVALTKVGQDTWTGSIDLVRSRHVHRATLSLAVVATVDGIPGRVIKSTEENWYADLDAVTPRRRQQVEIERIDFQDGPKEWLRPYQDAPWIVDTTDAAPKVYLNTSAIPELIEVLYAKGGTPEERALRDTTSAHIAQDAWVAMFESAISSLEVDEGTPLLPNDWRKNVIKSMLPSVFPGRTFSDALYEVHKRRQDGYGWSELQTGIHYAAAKRSRVTRRLTDAVRSVKAERDSR